MKQTPTIQLLDREGAGKPDSSQRPVFAAPSGSNFFAASQRLAHLVIGSYDPVGGRKKMIGMRQCAIYKVMGAVVGSLSSLAIAALIGLSAASLPLAVAVSAADSAPVPSLGAASKTTTASLSAVEKEKLGQKLKATKKKDKEARKRSSDPSTQAAYDKKVQSINRLIEKLNRDDDFALSEVDRAVASPEGSAK